MAEVYFTADTHFNHENIIHYCSRPFIDIFAMNNNIVINWNHTVREEDTVYILGDFCFEKKGLFSLHDWYLDLNGYKVFLKGNHDPSKLKGLDSASIRAGGLDIFMRHIPPVDEEDIPFYPDLILCGHVHEKWKSTKVTLFNNMTIPVINVGVDQWGFKPVNIKTILKEYHKIIKG